MSFVLIGCLLHLACTCFVSEALLEAYGCEQGWSHFGEHCYKIFVADVKAASARESCRNLQADLTSVWTPEEKEFILSQWQFPGSQLGFLWTGLRSKENTKWTYDDSSTMETTFSDSVHTWSILDGVSGLPSPTTGKCLALRPGGALAFLDCEMEASAFVCKKALPKVYTTLSQTNLSMVTSMQPIKHQRIFERMFPPDLVALPEPTSKLEQVEVSTEVGCAYRCFSLSTCTVFQVSCQTFDRCASFSCLLFADWSKS